MQSRIKLPTLVPIIFFNSLVPSECQKRKCFLISYSNSLSKDIDMNKQARNRGANYTQEEKSLLLDIIVQYKDIVENKKTNGIYVMQKKEAWNAITVRYNSNCTSGPRDTEQLKVLYDNMKQKFRKDFGESNIEMHKTGGGFWKPKMTDIDAKVLAIIQEQGQPLSNPNDSASSFFTEPVDPLACLCLGQEPETPLKQPSVSDKIVYKKKVPAHKIKQMQKSTSAEALKRLYFKKKCQNAELERKKLMMEIVHQKREHNLRIQILKNNLRSRTDNLDNGSYDVEGHGACGVIM